MQAVPGGPHGNSATDREFAGNLPGGEPNVDFATGNYARSPFGIPTVSVGVA